MYWLSARTRNDLFLLYAFADAGESDAALRRVVHTRVAGIPDLLTRVLDTPANIAYPIWVPCEFADTQFVVHSLPDPTWSAVRDALGALLATGVRANERPWRLHVFRDVRDAPGFASGEPALIAVLQLSHALADGRRASALARALFGSGTTDYVLDGAGREKRGEDAVVLTAVANALLRFPIAMARTVIRGLNAERARRELAALTQAGELPPPAPGVPPNLLNGDGSDPSTHAVRMIVCDADRLRTPGHTVTTTALTAISLALQRYLARHDAPADSLRAQVPMAATAPGPERNTYRDLSIDLSADIPSIPDRAAAIAAALASARTRAQHPLQRAQSRATDAIPAPILHRDVTHFPVHALPEQLSGHTVVSSVHRGPADLSFGGGPVRFTAGFPALGAVMHLTHGIHGLGDTITLSLHADPATLPDLDAYAALLEEAVGEVAVALRSGSPD